MKDEWTEKEARLLEGQEWGKTKTNYNIKCLKCGKEWSFDIGVHIQEQRGDDSRALIDYENSKVINIECIECGEKVKLDVSYMEK